MAKGRGGPFKVAWEVHGEGERHLVVSVRFSRTLFFPSRRRWKESNHRTKDFGKESKGIGGRGLAERGVRGREGDAAGTENDYWALTRCLSGVVPPAPAAPGSEVARGKED